MDQHQPADRRQEPEHDVRLEQRLRGLRIPVRAGDHAQKQQQHLDQDEGNDDRPDLGHAGMASVGGEQAVERIEQREIAQHLGQGSRGARSAARS
jgi:hypothetical protein